MTFGKTNDIRKDETFNSMMLQTERINDAQASDACSLPRGSCSASKAVATVKLAANPSSQDDVIVLPSFSRGYIEKCGGRMFAAQQLFNSRISVSTTGLKNKSSFVSGTEQTSFHSTGTKFCVIPYTEDKVEKHSTNRRRMRKNLSSRRYWAFGPDGKEKPYTNDFSTPEWIVDHSDIILCQDSDPVIRPFTLVHKGKGWFIQPEDQPSEVENEDNFVVLGKFTSKNSFKSMMNPIKEKESQVTKTSEHSLVGVSENKTPLIPLYDESTPSYHFDDFEGSLFELSLANSGFETVQKSSSIKPKKQPAVKSAPFKKSKKFIPLKEFVAKHDPIMLEQQFVAEKSALDAKNRKFKASATKPIVAPFAAMAKVNSKPDPLAKSSLPKVVKKPVSKPKFLELTDEQRARIPSKVWKKLPPSLPFKDNVPAAIKRHQERLASCHSWLEAHPAVEQVFSNEFRSGDFSSASRLWSVGLPQRPREGFRIEDFESFLPVFGVYASFDYKPDFSWALAQNSPYRQKPKVVKTFVFETSDGLPIVKAEAQGKPMGAPQPKAVVYKAADLMSCPTDSVIVHSIGADATFGAGIAKTIEKRFKVRATLRSRDLRVGEAHVVIKNGRRIANLVTKPESGVKPDSDLTPVDKSLKSLYDWAILQKTTPKLSFCMIETGLNGRKWSDVEPLIRKYFSPEKFEVTVYTGVPKVDEQAKAISIVSSEVPVAPIPAKVDAPAVVAEVVVVAPCEPIATKQKVISPVPQERIALPVPEVPKKPLKKVKEFVGLPDPPPFNELEWLRKENSELNKSVSVLTKIVSDLKDEISSLRLMISELAEEKNLQN